MFVQRLAVLAVVAGSGLLGTAAANVTALAGSATARPSVTTPHPDFGRGAGHDDDHQHRHGRFDDDV